MYLETVDHFAGVASQRSEFLKRSPLGFWISAMMAGAYVGLGIILIFSVGSDADPAYRALIMGASFGIALTLVVFAGSDLFTGHTMFMPLGLLRGRIGLERAGRRLGDVLARQSGRRGAAGCALRRRRRRGAAFQERISDDRGRRA
jgi:formate/nitrite transporter FocA (FNT family)